MKACEQKFYTITHCALSPQISVNIEWRCYRAVTVCTLKLLRNEIRERMYAPNDRKIQDGKK